MLHVCGHIALPLRWKPSSRFAAQWVDQRGKHHVAGEWSGEHGSEMTHY